MVIRVPSVPSEHTATFLAKRPKVPLVRTSAHPANLGIAQGNPPKPPHANHVQQDTLRPAPGNPSVNPARLARPPTPLARNWPQRANGVQRGNMRLSLASPSANLARLAHSPLAPLPRAHRAQRGNMWPASASLSVNPARLAHPPTPSAPKRPRHANRVRPAQPPLFPLPRTAHRAAPTSMRPTKA